MKPGDPCHLCTGNTASWWCTWCGRPIARLAVPPLSAERSAQLHHLSQLQTRQYARRWARWEASVRRYGLVGP